mmetsp:Transcript_54470/g.174669  ORF Transcript_54470/g.174669 Transcript_54470/m.174669 type:complete len:379 (-) Transcript_54470:519-1655(-)
MLLSQPLLFGVCANPVAATNGACGTQGLANPGGPCHKSPLPRPGGTPVLPGSHAGTPATRSACALAAHAGSAHAVRRRNGLAGTQRRRGRGCRAPPGRGTSHAGVVQAEAQLAEAALRGRGAAHGPALLLELGAGHGRHSQRGLPEEEDGAARDGDVEQREGREQDCAAEAAMHQRVEAVHAGEPGPVRHHGRPARGRHGTEDDHVAEQGVEAEEPEVPPLVRRVPDHLHAAVEALAHGDAHDVGGEEQQHAELDGDAVQSHVVARQQVDPDEEDHDGEYPPHHPPPFVQRGLEQLREGLWKAAGGAVLSAAAAAAQRQRLPRLTDATPTCLQKLSLQARPVGSPPALPARHHPVLAEVLRHGPGRHHLKCITRKASP